MRQKIIAGNWKMNHGPKEAEAFVKEFLPLVQMTQSPSLEWVIFPPYVTIPKVKELLEQSQVKYGAENCHEAESGAYTGEISASMLEQLKCHYTLIGHSERRQLFGETSEKCAKKIKVLIAHGITPMYCVGETQSERDENKTSSILIAQMKAGLVLWDPNTPLVIAYEPVWAIGTGKVATPAMAEEAHRIIRTQLTESFGATKAATICILYGGSVKPDNSVELSQQPNIDGFLVGGASLTAKSFAQIGQIPL